MEQESRDQESEKKMAGYLWVLSLSIGLAIGVGIGAALGSIGAGAGMGTGLGVAVGLLLVRRYTGNSSAS